MNSHYYVIGKNFDEMIQYTKNLAPNLNHVWVFDEVAITEENPTGVFIGNWRDRPDIMSIMNKLLDLTSITEKRILLLQIKQKVRDR